MNDVAGHDISKLGRSDLNDFLFAVIGIEDSGMPLSVVSALARLDCDPWQEAGRLARLPRPIATRELAHMIAALPCLLWPMPDATPIAIRLVALLPGQDTAPVVPARVAAPERGTLLVVAVVVMAFLVAIAARIPVAPLPSLVVAAPPVSASVSTAERSQRQP